MKKRKVLLVAILIIALIESSMFLGVVNTGSESAMDNTTSFSTRDTHTPIRINSDADFAGFPGSGTAADPYVIENYTIDAHDAGPGIYIGNTSSYFVIRNCTVFNVTTPYNDYYEAAGIRLANVQHAMIYNCTIHDVKYGVWENDSYNVSVENSTVYNFIYEGVAFTGANGVNLTAAYNNILGDGRYDQRGVYFSVAGSNLKASVRNNTINNTYYGIYLGMVYGVNVSGNTITNTGRYGIYANQGGNINVTGNTLRGLALSPQVYGSPSYVYVEEANEFNISYNKITDLSPYGNYGIFLDTSTNGSMYGNTFTNASIYIKEGDNGNYDKKYYTTHTIASSNTINGKPILFKKNVNLYSLPIDTTQYSELILANVSNIVINSGNYSHYGFGIILAYDSHALISGVSFYYAFSGISVEMSNNVTIENVVMNHVEYTGLDFEYNDYYKIENFTITDIGDEYYGGFGMYFAGYLNLGSNLIANNTITGFNYAGIEIDWGGNVTIANNTINGENRTPMYQDYYCGIMAYKNSDNVIIENNRIWGVMQGIYSDENYDNYTVRNNTIFDTKSGIYSYYDEYYGNYVRPVFSNNRVYNSTYGLYGYATNISAYDNEFYNCEYGMYLDYYTWYSVFTNNTLNVTKYGVYISDGYHNRFYNNTLLNGGFYLAAGTYEYSFTVSTILPENNTVNGKPVYYLFNTDYSTPKILDARSYGQVLLVKVNNLTMENLTAINATVGVEAALSSNITVDNGTFAGDYEAGVEFYKTDNSSVLSSSITESGYGVYLNHSSDVSVKYGNMRGNKYGVYLLQSDSNTVYGVNTTGNIIGLYLNSSTNNDVEEMNMRGDNIFMSGTDSTYTSQTIPTSNQVNGKSVYYLKNTDLTGTVVPSDAGEIIAANVQNLRMNGGNLSGGTVGMILFKVSGAYVNGLIMSNNTLFGLYALNSSSITVANGTLSDEDAGIVISNSVYVTITNGTIGDVTKSIRITSTDYVVISGNHIENARTYAVNVSDGNFVSIENNTILNTPMGIRIYNVSGLMGEAYYPLDEGYGSRVVDHSGNGNDGTIVNGTWVHGRRGAAIHFNGTGYAEIPMEINYEQLTVIVWFKADDLDNSGNPRLIANSHTDIDKNGFQIMFNASGQDGFFDVGNGTAVGNAYWHYSLKTGVWYMATLVYDGSTVKAYINDTLVGETQFNGGAINASGYDVMLGRNPVYNNTDFFNGSIDDVHIYSRALSDSEIRSIYLNGGGVLAGLEIENNSITNAVNGMYLRNVKGAYVCENTVAQSTYVGTGTPTGMFIGNTIDMEIFNSSVDGYYYGVVYSDVVFSTMHNVKIGNSTSYGVYVDSGSHGNLFYNNSFYFNHGSGSTYDSSCIQAYDAGHNQWNTTKLSGEHGYGNYWHDWTTPDSNGDGIVDNPYVLDGGASDAYPLTTPTTPVPELNYLWLVALLLMVFVLRRRK